MQPAEASVSPASIPDFAGMLAKFADPEKNFSSSAEFDGLEDDVATLSYENALRGLERVAAKAAEIADASSVESEDLPAWDTPAKTGKTDSFDSVRPASPAPASAEAGRKSASVTVRMSHAESELLRQRAAEAGITVSAYLRSCAFEVESLRAQVKETVAKLRAANAPSALKTETSRSADSSPTTSEKHHWWNRFAPPAKHRTATV
jgi:predicted DNA binding CopG/RHH family protein